MELFIIQSQMSCNTSDITQKNNASQYLDSPDPTIFFLVEHFLLHWILPHDFCWSVLFELDKLSYKLCIGFMFWSVLSCSEAKQLRCWCFLNVCRFSAPLMHSLSFKGVNSLILSHNYFFCFPLFFPGTVPWRTSNDDLVTCPYYVSFLFFTVVTSFVLTVLKNMYAAKLHYLWSILSGLISNFAVFWLFWHSHLFIMLTVSVS